MGHVIEHFRFDSWTGCGHGIQLDGTALTINHQCRRGNSVGGSAIAGMEEDDGQAHMTLEMVALGVAACSAAGIVDVNNGIAFFWKHSALGGEY
mmetsp:Transcript_36860/g.89518  ORF Transcript_36860/g.89518 Transcript_36860/m.89518 type:complete len:94 (+) Transcript_36860:2312-2593(+)